jgi:uncharacterized protein
MMRQSLRSVMLGLGVFATSAGAQGSAKSAAELRVTAPHGHVIAGVLETDAPAEPRPTVVLIAGAGPTDRDGYTLRTARGHNHAFRTLADRFVARGYAVVRYDKIGTGRSTGDYRATATTATLAHDVAAIVAALRARPEVDPDRIVLLGYSEGGAIAGRVAADDARIAGVALLAAPAWSGRRIMSYQVRLAAERQRRSLSYTSADLIEARMAGDLRDRLHTEAWYPFFLDYDPLPPFRQLTMPVLILQGERDEAVLFEQAYELREAVESNGNAAVSFVLLPGVGHAFTPPLERGARDRATPISDEVLGHLETWLTSLTRVPSVRTVRRGSTDVAR